MVFDNSYMLGRGCSGILKQNISFGLSARWEVCSRCIIVTASGLSFSVINGSREEHEVSFLNSRCFFLRIGLNTGAQAENQ